MNRDYIAENDAERERLKQLVARLSDDELSRPMPAGWTVAGVLAHMAFWDARVVFFIKRWESGIPPAVEDKEAEDIDWVNDSAKPLCLALPVRAAANLALQLAEEADARVAGMSDKLVEQMLAVGQPFALARAGHRREHLDEIEQVV